MAEFNYREFLKNNPLLKEEVKDSLITESKQPKTSLKENKYFTTDEDGDEILDLDLASEYLSQNHDQEDVDAFFSDDEVFEDLPYDSEDFPTEEAVEGALENAFGSYSGEGDVFEEDSKEIDVKEAKPSSKMKVSEFKAKIKEEILAALTEADKDEEEDVEVEDVEAEMDVEEPTMAPEVTPEEGLTADEQEIQDSLKIAYDNAVQIGDDKLADQIGNTITFFTRSHVVNK